jgi:hypothetical protein
MAFVLTRIADLYEPHGHVACGTNGMSVVERCVRRRHCQHTSGSVALITILVCGHPHSPASVPPYECDRRFHTGKSGFAASFQRQRWLSISARRHNGGKGPDRCHSAARRTPLIGRRARQQFGFKSDGPNSSRSGQGWVPKFSLSALGHKRISNGVLSGSMGVGVRTRLRFVFSSCLHAGQRKVWISYPVPCSGWAAPLFELGSLK